MKEECFDGWSFGGPGSCDSLLRGEKETKIKAFITLRIIKARTIDCVLNTWLGIQAEYICGLESLGHGWSNSLCRIAEFELLPYLLCTQIDVNKRNNATIKRVSSLWSLWLCNLKGQWTGLRLS